MKNKLEQLMLGTVNTSNSGEEVARVFDAFNSRSTRCLIFKEFDIHGAWSRK